MKKLGIDLDGCVCDFVGAFFKISNRMFHTDYTIQENWDFTQYTKAQVNTVWDEIKNTRNFWLTLKPEQGTNDLKHVLHNAGNAPEKAELFFITSRIPTSGMSVREQSCWFLRNWFHITYPTVIVVNKPEQKVSIVKALELASFLDDKRETVEEMNRVGVKSYVRLQPYNCQKPFSEGIVPVETLDEYLESELK